MALKTTLERLEAVESAIEKVMLGQTVQVDGMMINRSNLYQLVALEKYLRERYEREQGTSSTFTRGRVNY